MKFFCYSFIMGFLMMSCSIKKKPIFIKVDDIKIASMASDTLRLEANAFFKNPNDIGGKIATDKIKVMVNGTTLATVCSTEFKVPAKKQFGVPMQVIIPVKRIFENDKNGILGSLINSVLSQRIKVRFVGNIRYKVLGYSTSYPVDQTTVIQIKL